MFILYTLYTATLGNAPAAMLSLAMAAYLDFYPIYLLPSIIMYLRKSVTGLVVQGTCLHKPEAQSSLLNKPQPNATPITDKPGINAIKTSDTVQPSVTLCVLHFVTYITSLLIISRLVMGNWTFLRATYGFM